MTLVGLGERKKKLEYESLNQMLHPLSHCDFMCTRLNTFWVIFGIGKSGHVLLSTKIGKENESLICLPFSTKF